MALTFDGTSGYLKFTGAITTTAMPLTMFAHAKMTVNAANKRFIMSTGRVNAGDAVYCGLSKNSSTQYPTADHRTPGSSRSSAGTVAFPSANFQPVLGAFLATSTQLFYGSSLAAATADATARTDNLSLHEAFYIGANADLATPSATNMWAGDIGEVAMWSSDLSSGDKALLAGGALPETVSPSTLIDVWDLLTYNAGGTYTGRVNGKVLTSSGSGISQAATHPITRTTPDTFAPNLTSPTGTKTGSTTATGTVTTDEGAGTLYRMASVNATETVAAIVAANLTTTVTAVGVQNVSWIGLTPGTTYYPHYVQKDAASPVNTSAAANGSSFTTDAAPAAVLSGASGTATGTTTATATVSTTVGSGTLYFMFSTNATESAATIKASGNSQAVTAVGTQTVNGTGLTASTGYYSHFVQVANSQDSNVSNGSGFTTASVSAPILTSPFGTPTGTTTATANVTTNTGSGTLYALASVNPTESLATVKASGVQKTVTATGPQTVNQTGLTPATVYYEHIVHNAGGVDSGVSNSASFTTNAVTATVTINTVLKHSQGGLPLVSVAGRIAFYDKTTDALLARKTGLTTSPTGTLAPFSMAGLTAGVEVVWRWTSDANPLDTGFDLTTPA